VVGSAGRASGNRNALALGLDVIEEVLHCLIGRVGGNHDDERLVGQAGDRRRVFDPGLGIVRFDGPDHHVTHDHEGVGVGFGGKLGQSVGSAGTADIHNGGVAHELVVLKVLLDGAAGLVPASARVSGNHDVELLNGAVLRPRRRAFRQ
jgi:hypothetical protein